MNNPFRRLASIPILLSGTSMALAAAACADMTPLYPPSLASKVQLGDRSLAVDQINESRTDEGIPRLGVFGHSVVDFTQNIRYRVKWYDAGGIPIKTVLDAWQEKRLEGRAPYEFVAVGPSDKAVRYTVEIGPR